MTGLLTRAHALLPALMLAASVWPVGAQTVQVMPFGGYRFGGDLYEVITGTELDLDGAPSIGVVLDVPLGDGLSVTGLFSHQEARVDVPRPSGAPERVRLAIDYWQAGGTQEFGAGAVRPRLTGLLGLTRYGGSGDAEIRFSLSAGGGMVWRPHRRIGVALDGRVFAVLVDGDAEAGICAPGFCALALDVSVAWQAEFTAGLVVGF